LFTKSKVALNVLALACIVIASLRSFAPMPFSHSIVDYAQIPNGHKPKVIADFANNGFHSIGVASAGQGFKLYTYPDWVPYLITSYSNGSGDEDAQAVDINGDGALDIVIGGLNGNTYWLENPLMTGRNPYANTWQVHQIRSGVPSHDIVVGDVNRDGRVDVGTESGIYLQGSAPDTWTLVRPPQIGRSFEGTTLANLTNDGYLDVIAPYQNGTMLAWFENPMHTGGNPVTNIWTVHVIDPSPGFSGDMTTAAADFNGDGRLDIAMSPMYNDGYLVWYEAPADPRNGQWIKHTLGPSSYVHQGSLQIADFDGDGTPDIAFAEQEQSSTKRIGIYFNGGRGSSWTLQVLANTGGHNPKAGIIGNDRLPSLLSANHGFYGAPNPIELWRSGQGGSSPSHGPVSDNFNKTVLDTSLWTFMNPVGDATVTVNGSQALISLPPGQTHDLWTAGNRSARLMQSISDVDFEVEAKFDSIVDTAFQMQGILAEQDGGNYVRFEVHSAGYETRLFCVTYTDGVPAVRTLTPIALGSSVWLRLHRTGATWTGLWSTDGVSFTTGAVFTQVLAVTRVGPFAGNNAGGDGGASPGFTAAINYFFNTASPLQP
jgi:hypothetical protein